MGESWIGSESRRLSATVVLSLYLHCPLDKMPPLFFFQLACNRVILKVKNNLLGASLPPTEGRSSVFCELCSS